MRTRTKQCKCFRAFNGRSARLWLRNSLKLLANTTVMGEELYSLIKGKNLVAYPDADMRAHVTNAAGVETARGFRIAKEMASKTIDLAVALAMACCAALQAGKPIRNAHAVPIGVGRGLGAECARPLGHWRWTDHSQTQRLVLLPKSGGPIRGARCFTDKFLR